MGESLFPSSNDNALSVSQGRTEGHRWVKDAIPIIQNQSIARFLPESAWVHWITAINNRGASKLCKLQEAK